MAAGIVGAVLSSAVLFGAAPQEKIEPAYDARERRLIASFIMPDSLPADPTNAVADDPAAAHLGRFLFYEPRLSANGEISCATCHDPTTAFVDGASLARGIDDVARHTPTILNAAFLRWLFWDGRADTLWAQAMGPLEAPNEHGYTRLEAAHLIHDDAPLHRAYEAIFGTLPALENTSRFPRAGRPVPGDPAHPHDLAWASMSDEDRDAVNRLFSNLGKAIGAYERKLITGPAPFDRFARGVLAGETDAAERISPAARRGLDLYLGERTNCRLCHFGPFFTDGEFHATGVAPLEGGAPRDPGRFRGIAELKSNLFNAAGVYSDDTTGERGRRIDGVLYTSEAWGQFKTPALRGVALTPPYMHQGQFETLERVVLHYSTLEGAMLPSHHQEQFLKPLELTPEEIADLVAFLRCLSPTMPPEELLSPPATPFWPVGPVSGPPPQPEADSARIHFGHSLLRGMVPMQSP